MGTVNKRSGVTGSVSPGHSGGNRGIRILLAEDHTVVRDGLVSLINQESDMKVVAEAGDGRLAVDRWKQERPDITLMDLRMPVLGGVDAIYEIRAIDSTARIIILTTFDGDEDIHRAMRAGAKSYLSKDIKRADLFQCIREVHAGRLYLPPDIAMKLAARQTVEELTQRELQVLRLLAEGKSNKAIATDLDIAEVTVKSHVKALFSKLNVLSRTEAIIAGNRRGLLHL